MGDTWELFLGIKGLGFPKIRRYHVCIMGIIVYWVHVRFPYFWKLPFPALRILLKVKMLHADTEAPFRWLWRFMAVISRV